MDIGIERDGHVGIIELRRPPHNYFDTVLMAHIADALEAFDRDPVCRAVVLCAEGKSFSAGVQVTDEMAAAHGADVTERLDKLAGARPGSRHIYKETARLFRTKKPLIAAVQGAAIGGGMGLACAADFRVTCEEARFGAIFARMGGHPGFGLTVTLPRIVGNQKAAMLLYTGRRVTGGEAFAIGLADRLVGHANVRAASLALAAEIAGSAPLALLSIRETLRRGLAEMLETATERELVEQNWLHQTDDFREGAKAMQERRSPNFQGH